MSQNNTIRKSDKKFIRKEKARVRRQFLDVAKQEEMINELYKRFTKTAATPETPKKEKTEKLTEVKAEKPVKKAAPKKAAAK